MKRILLITLFVLTGLVTFQRNAFAQTVPEGLHYYENNQEIIIIGYTGRASILVIPERIQGLPVTYIWKGAYIDYYENLTGVTIPPGVYGIGAGVFSGCVSLTAVTFQGTIAAGYFFSPSFPGDLRDKYLAGGPGTYTRVPPSLTWTKQ